MTRRKLRGLYLIATHNGELLDVVLELSTFAAFSALCMALVILGIVAGMPR